jgi:hypothetical protein
MLAEEAQENTEKTLIQEMKTNEKRIIEDLQGEGKSI